MASIKCPHCGETFEAASGKTADIRAFARKFWSEKPSATVNEVAAAYFKVNPTANLNTILTQVRGARS